MQYKPRVLETKKSPRGFLVVPVHFRHDPDKDAAWENAERAKYALQADANRELDFDTREVLGAPAYPNFVYAQHVVDSLKVSDSIPLYLSCDFNVSPMVWDISQVHAGNLFVVDEIRLDPADVGMMALEFRNRYPAHPADIYVYGDATGSYRSPTSLQSCYDQIMIGLRGYPSPVRLMVPVSNPPVRERLASVNAKLKNGEGKIGVYIDKRCKELISDFEEVVLDHGGSDIKKTSRRTDPYSERTHASDGIGYLISRMWPIIREVRGKKRRHDRKHNRPRRYSNVLGAI